MVTSHEQLAEIKRVFGYPKLQKYIKREEAAILMETLYVSADIVGSIPDVNISKDPDDNKIITTAIAGNVRLLVSGDKADILSLHSYKDIDFVSAREAISHFNLL